MYLTKEDRLLIKDQLPHGSQLAIAKRIGVSVAAVNQYLKGKTSSSKIEQATIDVYLEFKRRKEETRKLILE